MQIIILFQSTIVSQVSSSIYEVLTYYKLYNLQQYFVPTYNALAYMCIPTHNCNTNGGILTIVMVCYENVT